MCEEKLVRKQNRAKKLNKTRQHKGGTLASQQKLIGINKRYRNTTKIKVTLSV
mgnify:CR=1 FL=1